MRSHFPLNFQIHPDDITLAVKIVDNQSIESIKLMEARQMAANDIIVLNSILEQKKIETANSWPDDDFFELFTFEQRLKEYNLSNEQLQFCKIGGGDDGGIDGFFTFVNDELIAE